MYPDAISIVRGEEEYTWWLNPNLIGLNTFELAGIPLDQKASWESHRVHVKRPAPVPLG
jgi:hypothetical protein